MRRIFAGLVTAVAMVAGRNKISEIDGIEGIERLWEVMVIGFSRGVIFTQQIADSTERTCTRIVDRREGVIVAINVSYFFP